MRCNQQLHLQEMKSDSAAKLSFSSKWDTGKSCLISNFYILHKFEFIERAFIDTKARAITEKFVYATEDVVA